MITIGIDESGRGCCAGNIVAGAVAFIDEKKIDFIKLFVDSKKTNKIKRADIYTKIKNNRNIVQDYAIRTSVDIDRDGIQKSNTDVMIDAARKVYVKLRVMGFKDEEIQIIADGTLKLSLDGKVIESIIKADSKVKEVSAASIVAKYMKDIEMVELSEKYPHFKFMEHSGYCNKKHMDEVDKYGAMIGVHRFCYSPIAQRVKKP